MLDSGLTAKSQNRNDADKSAGYNDIDYNDSAAIVVGAGFSRALKPAI